MVASIDITDLVRVKDIMKITDATDDVELTTLIDAVGQEIESMIDAPLLIATFTEEYTIKSRQRHIWLNKIPVTAVTTFKSDSSWDWVAADPLVADDDYHIDLKNGHVWFEYLLESGFKAFQAVYTAGLAATTAALITAAPNLVHAADLMIVQEWRRKNNIAATGRSIGSGKQSWEGELKFPKRSMELIAPYRNRVMA